MRTGCVNQSLREIDVPEDEITDLTQQIKGGDMNRLFENIEKYDVQAIRKESRAEGLAAGREEGLAEGLAEGMVIAYFDSGMSIETIADKISKTPEYVTKVLDENQLR